MQAALDRGDLLEVGRLGHRMKGTLAYLGAASAKEAAMRVERFSRLTGRAPAEAAEAVAALQCQCHILKAALADAGAV